MLLQALVGRSYDVKYQLVLPNENLLQPKFEGTPIEKHRWGLLIWSQTGGARSLGCLPKALALGVPWEPGWWDRVRAQCRETVSRKPSPSLSLA